ncbi:MAG TPA: hypothetical protein VF715_13515 [Thermoleophilaceae bacterium]
MIELEHAQIHLAAIGARVGAQMVRDDAAQAGLSAPQRTRRLVPVDVTALAEVDAKALAAPVLGPAAVAVEGAERKLQTASSASLHIEHMFA